MEEAMDLSYDRLRNERIPIMLYYTISLTNHL